MINFENARAFVSYDAPLDSKDSGVSKKELKLSVQIEQKHSGQLLSIRSFVEKGAISSFCIRFAEKIPLDSQVLLNGYQSWTDTRRFTLQEKIHPMAEPAYSQYSLYGDYNFFPDFQSRSILRSHNWVTIENNQQSLFLGSLTEHDAFSLFLFSAEGEFEIRRDFSGVDWPGGELEVLRLFQSSKSLHDSFKAYAQELGTKSSGSPAAGYTSWYHLYNRISEKSILKDLSKFKKANISLDFFQIDDGFQESIGNWTETNEKFPSGLAELASNIHAAGYQAGLWLAPFLCQGQGWLQKHHSDFLLLGADGQPMEIGINPGWGGAYYALDLFNNQVLEYLKETFHTILFEFNFDLVKLDFLFAACAIPRNGLSRGKQMRRAMELIREWVTFQKKIIGCGVPLSSAGGLVDYCRIGADVEFQWETEDLKACHYRERVSNENAILNSLYRSLLNGNLFSNDPDVFILRDVIDNEQRKPILLSEDQRLTLFLINQVCGDLLFISDPPDEIPVSFVDLYLSSFPVFSKTIQSIKEDDKVFEVSFSVEGHNFMLLVNLNDKPASCSLPSGLLFDRLQCQLLEGGGQSTLPPYGSALYHLCNPESIFLGSSSHLFCGVELQRIAREGDDLQLIFKDNCKYRGETWLKTDKVLSHNGLYSSEPAFFNQDISFATI